MLSKKKIADINEIGMSSFTEVLRQNRLHYWEANWFDDPIDTWSDEQKIFFDALDSLKDKITIRVVESFDKK